MRRIDILIGVVIVAAVVFSFVGVATYEAVSPDTQFDVQWSTSSRDLPQQTATQAGNGERTINYPIEVKNLTNVDLTVRVVAPGPRASQATARVTVEPVNLTAPPPQTLQFPAGQAMTREASFSIKVSDLPDATTASGQSENDTHRKLAQEHESTKGTGTWIVKVQWTGGQSVPVVGAGAETIQITVIGKATTYNATLQPSTPDLNR